MIRELLTRPWIQKLLGLKNLVIEPGSDLELTWSSMPPAWVVVLLIIPGIIIAFGLIYRNERRDAPSASKIVMSFCRILVVLMVVLMLFGPALTVEVYKDRKAYVMILVDDSLSMAKPDRPRLAEDQMLVARAVYEQVPDSLTPEQLEKIRSMTRLEIVQAALRNKRMNVVEELQKKMNVAFYRFSSKVTPHDEKEIQALVPTGTETAIGEAINQAMAERRGSTVLGVIVITDGRNNAGQDPEAIAEQLRGRYVSVYAVAPGVARKPMDLKLLDLEAPEAAIAGDHVRVKYRVHSEGYPGETIKTRLYLHALMDGMEVASTYAEAKRRVEGLKAEADKVITLEGEEFRKQEEFTMTPREPGLFELIVFTDVLEGEATEENNFLSQRFLVADEKIMVLYVDHWPRWEYRFLKNALIRDSKIKAHILLTSADKTFPQDCSPGLEPIKTFPETLKELLKYDVVILGDVPLGMIGGPPTADMLATFSSEFGGGIAFIGGTDSNPRGYADTPLAKILPVVPEEADLTPALNPYETNLPYKLTKEGEEDEVTRLKEDKEANRQFWNGADDGSGLPRVRFYVPVKKVKTNARVLVHLLDPTKEEPVPLFVTMFFGQGRIFFSATDETYRWRWLHGDYPYFYPFWQHVMYWARKGKLLGLHRFRITVERDRYAVGETVNIVVVAYDQDMNPIDTKTVPTIEIYVEPPSGDRIVLPLAADDTEREGLFRGTFTPKEVGDYRLWAGESTDLTRDITRFSVFIPNREEENPIIDEKKMRAIAAASYVSENEKTRVGNENFYMIDQLDALAATIQGHDVQLKETREDDLWDAPLVYILFALLITAEWILRKIFRML